MISNKSPHYPAATTPKLPPTLLNSVAKTFENKFEKYELKCGLKIPKTFFPIKFSLQSNNRFFNDSKFS